MPIFKKNRKHVCSNCHFLKLNGELKGIVLNDERRAKIREGNFDIVNFYGKEEPLFFMCHRGVWDEGFNGRQGFDRSNDSRQKIINEDSRENFCFFWKYRPGMFFDSAVELQKRDYKLKYARKDRTLTILGLWIAALALIANIIITII
jgi:hypothetical protein